MPTDTGFEMTACTKYEALLEDYLEGTLDAAESMAVEKHWRNCGSCRIALDQASASVRLLRSAGPPAGPGPAFARAARRKRLLQLRSLRRLQRLRQQSTAR